MVDHGAELVELDELLGYHLEQAARYGLELGRPVPELAARAAALLGTAGVRALDRVDMYGAANLLSRSRDLFGPDDPAHMPVLAALATRLEDCYGRDVTVLGLSIAERETIIRALDDPPSGLEELRGVLLAEHVGRKRVGLA